MSIQIKLKNSVVQDSTPSASDLPEVGELAVNGNINSIGGFMRASDNTIVKIFGPGSVTTPTATTTVSGISELATNSETTTGTATNRVVTPAGLNAVTVAERTTSNSNYVAKAGSTLTGVLTMPNGSNSAPAINFGDSDSGIFGGTNTVSLAAGGTTRLTADTGVSVVGTLAVTGAITSTDDLTIPDKIIHSGDTNTAVRFPAADTVSVETGGNEAFRVDSSQHLLVGSSTSVDVGSGAAAILQVEHSGSNLSAALYSTINATGPAGVLALGHARGSASGILLDDDVMGQVRFAGGDGVDLETVGAQISAEVDGTPGSNDMPGRLVFQTTADGAASPTERMRIDSSGRVGIGQSANLGSYDSSADRLVVGDGSADEGITIVSGQSVGHHGSIFFADGTGSTNSKRGQIRYEQNNETMKFATAGSERLRIDSSGRLLLGLSSGTSALLQVDEGAQVFGAANDGNSSCLTMDYTSSTGRIMGHGSSGGNLAFFTNLSGSGVTERMRIDTAGRLLIGHSVSQTIGSNSHPLVQLNVNSNQQVLTLARFENASAGPSMNLGKSRASSAGNYTVVQNGDSLGSIQFSGADGTDLISRGAAIEAQVDGTPGSNDMPGRLVFMTSADGSDSPTERLRIDSSGRLLLGTTTEGYHDADDLTLQSASGYTGITLRAADTAGGAIYFSDATSGNGEYVGQILYSHASNVMTFATNASERMRIDSSGEVGIGTTSPDQLLSLQNTSAQCQQSLTAATNGSCAIYFGDTDSVNRSKILHHNTGDYLSFSTAASERMRIDSSGNVGIGTTSPNEKLVVQGNSSVTGALFITSNTSTPSAGAFLYRPASNTLALGSNSAERMRIDSSGNVGIGTTSPDTPLTVSRATTGNVLKGLSTNNNTRSRIELGGKDSSGNLVTLMLGGDGDFGGMVFTHTNHKLGFATNNAAPQMVLDTSGNVGLGVTSVSNARFRIKGANNTTTAFNDGLYVESNNGSVFKKYSWMGIETQGGMHFSEITGGVGETMRIGTDGNVGIGVSTMDARLHVVNAANQLNMVIATSNTFTGNASLVSFRSVSSEGGFIALTNNGTTTAFGTSSDYRLKENATTISDGITRLKTLKPYRFNFKAAPDTTVDGFFAHEVTAVPEAVIGEKDGEQMQGLDYAKLTPLLTAALQEAITKIEILETKVAALETA